MKFKTFFFLLSSGTALVAQPVSPTINGQTPPHNFAMPSGPLAPPDAAPTPDNSTAPDNSVVPSANFAPARYQALWTKSPFAVETAEVSMDTSPDYMLVGIANIDGISYASVMESRPPQEHFLISSDKPTRGMTLGKINRSQDGTDTYATVLKDGQTLTLKLQQAPAANPGAPQPGMPMLGGMTGTAQPGTPGSIIPNIQVPGANPQPTGARPFPRIHRPTIHLPNQNNQQQFTPPPPPPQPAPAR